MSSSARRRATRTSRAESAQVMARAIATWTTACPGRRGLATTCGTFFRGVNLHQKRERLPGDGVLHAAGERIQAWWDAGYLKSPNAVLPERFRTEVRASLPPLHDIALRLEDGFAAVAIQSLRLKRDQQVPVWGPPPG